MTGKGHSREDKGADGLAEALRASQERYRNLFEFMSSGFALFRLEDAYGVPEPRHRLVQANIEFERLMGIDRIRDAGRSLAELGLDWPPEVVRNHRRVAQSGGFVNYERYDPRRSLHFEVRVFSPQQGTYAVLLNDISARKEAEAELASFRENLERLVDERTRELEGARAEAEAANRTKSMFLASMSHELRTPMNAILGFTRLLRADKQTGDSQREKLGIVERAGENLLSMINDILDFSKLDSGKVEVRAEHFDPVALAREVVDLLRERADSKGLRLTMSWGRDVPRSIRSDPVKIRQILINLVGNALKFTSDGGIEMRLALDPDGRRELLLGVADTGIGISEADLGRIFDPFEQVERREGTGLGLSISRQYARLLGGDLSARSIPGKGSVFTARVAFEESRSEAEPPPVGEDSVATALPTVETRVLVVEDHPDNRLLLRNLLEPLGLSVREAGDGDQGVALVRDWQPDLVFMDRRMPVLDGLQAVREIRGLRIPRQPVVVALTAHAFDDERQEMLDAGCDEFVAKPFQESQLFDVLERRLGVHPSRHRRAGPGDPNVTPGPDDLRSLPTELGDRLVDALLRADMLAIDGAMGEVGAADPALRARLAPFVDGFEYAALVRSLRGLKSGKEDAE